MKFTYQAKNLQGKEISGTQEAQDEKALAEIFKQKGYFLIFAESELKTSKPSIVSRFSFLEKIFGVSLSEKIFFTKNLEVMIKTGVSLPRAFSILSKQTKSRMFKKALAEIAEQVIKGKSFSESLVGFPEIFSPLYREIVQVGEETGKLEEALGIAGDQIAKEYDLKSRIKGAMVYPTVVLCMAVGIGIFMMIFAVPKMKEAFSQMDVDLPLTTRIIINFGDFLKNNWLLVGLVVIVLSVAVFWLLKKGKGGKIKSFVALKIPVVSKIFRKTNTALTLRILASLLKSGVPIVRALEICSGALGNYYFRESLTQAAKVVEKGQKISQALLPFENLYSPMVLQMMEVGEETGETPNVLAKLADFYEAEVLASTQKLSSIIEPFLILFLGGAVGFFAVSMMQPMFSVMGGIK